MSDFEDFMREKITRLRLEADALEKTLKEYTGVKARQSGAQRRAGDQPRGGAFGVILEAIGNAGPQGLSLDDMIEAAAAEGYEVRRNTLRSQIWQAKEDKQIVQLAPGKYRAFDAEEIPGLSPVRKIEPSPVFSEPEPPPRGPRESFSAALDDEIPF